MGGFPRAGFLSVGEGGVQHFRSHKCIAVPGRSLLYVGVMLGLGDDGGWGGGEAGGGGV